MDRVKKVILRDEVLDSGIHVFVSAKFNEKGDLVVSGFDSGAQVKVFWGDDDYEYWVTVRKEDRDIVLLELIKERFKDEVKFREWLESKKIPFEFTNWV